MKTLSIREARKALSHLDQLVAEHRELLITRHGRPVVRILPVQPTQPVPTHDVLRASIRPQATPTEDLLRQERDER